MSTSAELSMILWAHDLTEALPVEKTDKHQSGGLHTTDLLADLGKLQPKTLCTTEHDFMLDKST